MQPDPVLTASVYCNRRLDEVIHGAVAPFRARLREEGPGDRWSLWMVRYAKRGEHLKLRLHGPADEAPAVMGLLQEAVDDFLAALPPAADGEARFSRPRVPSIDEEDDGDPDHPDRVLLQTRYRRSHVNLGPTLFLGDDGYVTRVVDGLSHGADLVLEAILPDANGRVSGSTRQKALLKALVAGLSGTGFSPEERLRYLAYHRDWLLRFSVADAAQESQLIAKFDARLEGMRAAALQIRGAAAAQWNREESTGEGREREWRRALRRLTDHVARFRGDPAYRVDPFTDDPVFPVVFKVFHGVGNQLGLGMLDEAFIHHLLLHSASADAETLTPAGAAR